MLNDGRAVEFAVDLVPSEHASQAPCLRLRKLPVEEFVNTVLVIKLEFDSDPGSATVQGDQRPVSKVMEM